MKFIAQNDLKISLKEKGKTHRVFLKNISYIKSESYLSRIYFAEGKKSVVVSKLLKTFEEELAKYGFLRICRNVLINKRNVRFVFNNNTRKIVMTCGTELTISQRNYPKINNILNK
jgi:two-component system LytT family response regulator